MKRLCSFFLAIIIGYGGLKIYLHAKIQDQVDTWIHALSSYAVIEYKGISTSLLDKAVTLEGIQITPEHSAAPVSIESITLTGSAWYSPTPDPMSILDFETPMNQNFKIKNLKILLDEQMAYGNSNLKKNGQNAKLLTDLGYNILLVDMTLQVRTIPEHKQIEIDFNQVHHNMFQFGLHTVFTKRNVLKTDAPQNPLQDIQVVRSAFHFRDLSFLDKMFQYEAKKQNKPVEQIKEDALQRVITELKTKKMDLEATQIPILKKVVFESKPLTIRIQPMDPMGMAAFRSLPLYKPEDVQKILNLKFTNE